MLTVEKVKGKGSWEGRLGRLKRKSVTVTDINEGKGIHIEEKGKEKKDFGKVQQENGKRERGKKE